MVSTGIAVAIPKNYEIQIRPRSGLAAKKGISVLNTPGTIDSDYRGEIKIILINLSQKSFLIKYISARPSSAPKCLGSSSKVLSISDIDLSSSPIKK